MTAMVDATEQPIEPPLPKRNAVLALVLGGLLGGVVFFYVRPPRRAWWPCLMTYGLVALSGGSLWLPVFLAAGLIAAREARISEGRHSLHGDDPLGRRIPEDAPLSVATAPAPYLRIRSRK